MPSGSDPATATKEMITSSISPPHRVVSTKSRPNTPPHSSSDASAGNTVSSSSSHSQRCRDCSRSTACRTPPARRRARSTRQYLAGRVAAVEEQRQAHADERPARAIARAVGPVAAEQRSLRDGPAEQRRQQPGRHSHDNSVSSVFEQRAEQVAAQPVDRQRAGRARREVALQRQALLGGGAHRPTSATRRLYQFISADAARLMDRKIAISRAIVSISRDVCCSTVPAKIWNSSG